MNVLPELIAAPARQAVSVEEAAHRPWPLPAQPWVLGQTWEDLLFLHWRVPSETLRPLVSPLIEVEQHDGSAWIGITPFRLAALRLRGLLPLPGISSFLELNVRTYVTDGEKPGIWFFSLDAASRFAVEAARAGYKLPYFAARMRSARVGEWITYESVRAGAVGVAFAARYRPVGPEFEAEAGSLEEFLADRYCLYTDDAGRLKRAEIHHRPWTLRRAEAEVELNTMAPVELPDDDPHLLWGGRQDVVLWALEDARKRQKARKHFAKTGSEPSVRREPGYPLH
jgi:uncharacterized protein YqjF (DUF2071 family)